VSDWHNYPPGPRLGLWQRFKNWLMGDRRPTPESPRQISIHETDEFSFSTPAKGDGFAFLVDVRCDWCASGMKSEEDLQAALAAQRANIREKIIADVRTKVRHIPAHRADEAEALFADGMNRCFVDGEVQCDAWIRVMPALEIANAQQTFALGLQRLDAERELTAARIAHMHALRDLWAEFLREGIRDWVAPHASHLAEVPHNLGPLIQNMLAERRADTDRLIEETGSTIARLEQVDVLDLVVKSETALRKTLELLGVPVPELDPTSPLAGNGGAR